MNVRLRERLINAAIWSTTLSVVLIGGGTGCSADAGESGLPQTHTTSVDACRTASGIGDYVVRYEDGTVAYVTPREDVRQASLRGVSGKALTLVCVRLVRQAVKDGVTVR